MAWLLVPKRKASSPYMYIFLFAGTKFQRPGLLKVCVQQFLSQTELRRTRKRTRVSLPDASDACEIYFAPLTTVTALSASRRFGLLLQGGECALRCVCV